VQYASVVASLGDSDEDSTPAGSPQQGPSSPGNTSVHLPDGTSESGEEAPLNWTTLMLCYQHAGSIIFFMVIVYFLEYLIYPGFVDRDTNKTLPDGVSNTALRRSTYTLAWACYNIGVTVSRSSVSFFVIPKSRIWILSALQAVNAVLWFFEAYYHFLPKALGDAG